MIRSAFYCALALAGLLFLTSHVGSASPSPASSPADLCPPPAHTTTGDACEPCTVDRCRPVRSKPAGPATWIRCRVTIRLSRGADHFQATGILTTWNVDPDGGWEYAELDGELDRAGTGPVRYLTTEPPIELEVLSCPR